jgi:hypothetical protein
MNRLVVCIVVLFFTAACKNKKKKENTESFFPVLSFLQSQVRGVDTSLYRIVRLEKQDGQSNTTYISRNDFRSVSAPFLNLPDISSDELKDDYEESKIFEQASNQVILTYTTAEKDNEIQREDVILGPGTNEFDKVETIIIHQVKNAGDSTVIRNMVWYVDKRFTIVTKTQKENKPDKVNTVEVIWNDFKDPQDL